MSGGTYEINFDSRFRTQSKKLGEDDFLYEKQKRYIDSWFDILTPDLSIILNGKEASYSNLYSQFVEYCNKIDGKLILCGLSLGGILALNYALDFPEKVNSLILIGTPYKVPKVMFRIQNIIFKFLPKSLFESMAFNQKDTFILGDSMKDLDFSNDIKNIKCKTLIICGKKDKANIKSAYYLSENIENSRLKIMNNTGHIVNEEIPDELAIVINNFIKV